MNLLVIKTSSLGDILHTFPAVSYLRHKFPDATIDWVVEERCAPLVINNPDVSNAIVVNTRKLQFNQLRQQKYDVIFDLQGNIKSGLITFFARGGVKVGFGKKTVAEWPNLLFTHKKWNPPPGKNIREDYLHVVKSFFADQEPFQAPQVTLKGSSHLTLPNQKKIMVCPGAAWVNKQLPKEKLIEVLQEIQREDSLFVFCWGTPAEHALVKELSALFPSIILEKLPLPELQHLMRSMDLIVAMDSLPLHLAATTNVPTLSFFGPSSSTKYAPEGPRHEVRQGACPYNRTFEKRCPILRTCPTGACMKFNQKETL